MELCYVDKVNSELLFNEQILLINLDVNIVKSDDKNPKANFNKIGHKI